MDTVRKGFTLIELLVLLAIIGILAAMIVPAVKSAVDKAQRQNKNIAADVCVEKPEGTSTPPALAVPDAVGPIVQLSKSVIGDSGWGWGETEFTVLVDKDTGNRFLMTRNSNRGFISVVPYPFP